MMKNQTLYAVSLHCVVAIKILFYFLPFSLSLHCPIVRGKKNLLNVAASPGQNICGLR